MRQKASRQAQVQEQPPGNEDQPVVAQHISLSLGGQRDVHGDEVHILNPGPILPEGLDELVRGTVIGPVRDGERRSDRGLCRRPAAAGQEQQGQQDHNQSFHS